MLGGTEFAQGMAWTGTQPRSINIKSKGCQIAEKMTTSRKALKSYHHPKKSSLS